MIDFVQLQEIARDRLEYDRTLNSVDAVGATLDAAVFDAAALLDVPVRRLEYEIVEKGSDGFLGVGKKEWRIRAYEHVTSRKKQLRDSLFTEDIEEDIPLVENKDGEAYVHFKSGGDVMLKVTPPAGEGSKAPMLYTMQLIEKRGPAEIDENLVERAVKESSGNYVKVGTFKHNALHDSSAMVEIIEGEMKAYIQVIPPEDGGCDISYDRYINVLKANRIIHGILEDFLQGFADRPVYQEKILAAEGTKAVDGKDAYIQYNFETDLDKTRFREKTDGRVDFKDLNIIQNVVENQPLAKKIPPKKGVAGKTVTGSPVPAKDGKDINLPIGSNVHLDSDDVTILADMNGQVVLTGSLINVEPVYTVNGDVNLKTGNIIFLGTVYISGNVEDGFSVKAAGNIEVNGSVGKAELEAEGDVIIHQGINGRGEGIVTAGKSIWARFIQNANIKAGDMVVASDGIINSQVDASSRIICQGKRASIMGGRLRALEEINAKVLGNSTSGTETICEVGYDPKSKEELGRLFEVKDSTEKQLEDIKLNIQTLVNIKKQRKSLPEDKEIALQEFMDRRGVLLEELKKTDEGIKKIQEFLNSLKTRGKVSASSKVYPGVKVVIRDARDEVRTEYKAVTFVLENGLIRVTAYEDPDTETKKGLDGYTTN